MTTSNIIKLWCLLGLVTSLKANPSIIKGHSYRVSKNVATHIPGLCTSSYNRTTTICPPPLPNLDPDSSVPVQNPNALPGAFFPNPTVSNSLTPPPQTIDLTFVANRQGTSPVFIGTPPDTFGSKGLTQFIMGDNNGIISFDENGNRDNMLDTEVTTIANLDGNFSLFISNRDVRCRYDRLTDRYVLIFIIIDDKTQGYSGFTLCVSDSGIITENTQWTVLTIFDSSIIPDKNGCPGDINNVGCFYDYPCLGIDAHALYVAFSVFEKTTSSWVSNTLFVIQKSSLYNGSGPVVLTAFRDITKTSAREFVGGQASYRANSTVFPLDNYDDPNPAFGYAICTDPVFFGRLNLFRILNAGSTSPSLVGPLYIDVMATACKTSDPTTGRPILNQLYDILGSLEPCDDRLADTSHINKKQIYTGHAITVDQNGTATTTDSRSGIRWYQLDVTDDPTGQGLGTETATTIPALVQAGTLFDPAPSDPLYYTFPAIMSNSQGDISICGTVSSINTSPSAFFVGKSGKDPKDGILRIGTIPPNTYAIGNGRFSRSLGVGNASGVGVAFAQRWGDMSFSSLDPVDKKTIWTIQEICQDGCEVQVVAKLVAP